jgi:zinc transporter, ZIP family
MGELLRQVFTFIPFAIAAGIAGGIVAISKPPRDLYRSMIQHLAAGLLSAIIAVDLLPEILNEGEPVPILIGFAIGSVLMIIMKGTSNRLEDRREDGYPIGLVGVAGIDTAIDGMIIGFGFATRDELGFLLTVALAIELFVLTLSVASELQKEDISSKRTIITTTIISSMLAIGAASGVLIAGNMAETTIAAILSFAAAALLYLVTEELLIKGNDAASRARTTAAFFFGFLALMAFTVLGPG